MIYLHLVVILHQEDSELIMVPSAPIRCNRYRQNYFNFDGGGKIYGNGTAMYIYQTAPRQIALVGWSWSGRAPHLGPGIQFFSDSDDSTTHGQIRMTIAEGGNVGIGTDDPGSLLDVSGNANITGMLENQKLIVSRSSHPAHATTNASSTTGMDLAFFGVSYNGTSGNADGVYILNDATFSIWSDCIWCS